MIEVHDLTKRYGGHTALKGISFTAQKGEILGLLGPNGAGKTTTMRILTGFMPPTAGSAKVAGFDVQADSFEVRRRVGYMPERVPLYPDMTVEGYLAFWARLRGVARPAQQARAALDRVNLLDRRQSLVRNLSKGMRQRLGLAQALVHDPEVIILDEPTIGIDPQQVIEVRESVRALAAQHTVLFSTHILSEAEQVCDRVIILNQGEVVAEGGPAELRHKLQPGDHLYVALGGLSHDAARKLLHALPGVTHVEAQPTALRDAAAFIVRSKRSADVRGALSDAVLKANAHILELRPVAMTLEDIFLDIVGRK